MGLQIYQAKTKYTNTLDINRGIMYADEVDTDSVMTVQLWCYKFRFITQVVNTFVSPGLCLISCVDVT